MTERSAASRERSRRWGEWAERLAALYLLGKGYRIVARNFRTKAGEVDVIARKANLVLFVEVKARATEEAALSAVSAASRRRIENAGQAWLARQHDGANLSWRNDVVAVVPWRMPRHFTDVW